MRLQPNPPRMVTVVVAVVVLAIGLIWAWPIDSLVPLLEPVTVILESVGLTADRELGYLCLFVSPTLLVAGSLLPGI